MSINRLLNNSVYLCGPIDNAKDGGKVWRIELTKELLAFGITVLDPTNKPIKELNENDEDIILRKKIKQEGRFDELALIMKDIRAVDLRMCDLCNFVVVYIDLDIVMCGTWEEIFWCNRMKKPCLVVIKQGKKLIPDWLFGTIPHQHMFSSFEELKLYLYHINSDEKIDHLKRWMFFNLDD